MPAPTHLSSSERGSRLSSEEINSADMQNSDKQKQEMKEGKKGGGGGRDGGKKKRRKQ